MQERVLEGKIAVVTGAASPRGLGRAMTEALVLAGAKVSMIDINQKWLDDSSCYMREIGGGDCVIAQMVDVTSISQVESSVERTVQELGGLHILINNAGIAPKNTFMGGNTKNNFWDVSPADWERTFAVNSSGPFYMARTVVPHMLAQGWGRIIGVTTNMNIMYREGRSPYGPSKAAHEALVAMASRELEGTGVTANVLLPGAVANTDLIPNDSTYERDSMLKPEVVQSQLVWLASEASNGINGQRLSGCYWDEDLPLGERLEKAATPAAWPQLGSQAIKPSQ